MGIPLFFRFYKDNFKEQTKSVKPKVTLPELEIEIDNLMLDLNGPIHNATQKIYGYGAYAKPPRMLGERIKVKSHTMKTQQKVFENVCLQIEKLLTIVCPKKRLIICIDGPAPLGKQAQQRKRRYKSAMDNSGECEFDSNSITPGTEFMDRLGKYIDWYIRSRLSKDERWQSLEVIFSSDRACGEGEHKAMTYMRKYGNSEETFCINGCDADLIMLALGTHLPHIYVLREDIYDDYNDYYCLDIGGSHDRLAEIMYWESDQHVFLKESAVNDFIFLCFMVGNDFLPHIPSIEIIEDGINMIISVYKEVCGSYGHITETNETNIRLIKRPLAIFMATIGHYEKELLDTKLTRKSMYYQDMLLESCSDISKNENKLTYSVNIAEYRKKYCETLFPACDNIENICHQYIEGMQWVLSYYLKGVPSWRWLYPYHYAPPAHILAQHINTFEFPVYEPTVPNTPFQQLLCVLPPKSAHLLPTPLNDLLESKLSPLRPYCPDDFEIDVSGKRKEWEGIVLLPMVDYDLVCEVVSNNLQHVDPKDLARNSPYPTVVYEYDRTYNSHYCSKYGSIKDCKVKTKCIELLDDTF